MLLEKKAIIAVAVNSISHYTKIPDWITESNSELPIVVKNGDVYECIEKWDTVEKAKDEGKLAIECLIIEPEIVTKSEVAIQKAASRIKTLGGEASYPERLKSIRHLLKALIESRDELSLFAHGGCRKGENFDGNDKYDAIALIVNRLGINRKTILAYLAHGRYLDDTLLDDLVKSQKTPASRTFFEEISKPKKFKVEELSKSGKSEVDITEEISSWVRERFEAISNSAATERAGQESSELGSVAETAEAVQAEQQLAEGLDVSQFSHHTPSDEDGQERQTFESVREEVVQITRRKSEEAESKWKTANRSELIAEVEISIEELQRVLSKLKAAE